LVAVFLVVMAMSELDTGLLLMKIPNFVLVFGFHNCLQTQQNLKWKTMLKQKNFLHMLEISTCTNPVQLTSLIHE
jgi:hypothetical protein